MHTTARVTLVALSALGLAALVGCAAAGSSRSAVSDTDLLGVWTVEETFDSPEQPYVSFTDDGNWTSSDGCNTVAGTWRLGDLGAITTTARPSTLVGCAGVPLPMVMAQASFVQVDGDLLVVTGAAEPTTTALVRTTDPKVGPQGPPSGMWSESSDPNAPFIDFAEDGSFSGNDGCNNIFGSWKVSDDGSVEFDSVGSTLMACDGVDEWLTAASQAYIVAGVMSIQDASGLVVGELTQQ